MTINTSTLINQLEKNYGDWGKILTTSEFMETVTRELAEHNYKKQNSRLVFSVCPDDVNRLTSLNTIENVLKDKYDGEFHLGGLGAYPMGGVSGIVAASHHPPDNIINGERKGGNLIFFISPHFGVIEIEKYIYGKIIRPGQEKITDSCGAIMGFLNILKEAGETNRFQIAGDPNNIDPTRTVLHSELINNYSEELNEILDINNKNEQVLDIFKLNYDLVINKIENMIRDFLKIEKEHFMGNIALIGGITVNKSSGDLFILREIIYPMN
jgi:hypothetical protein